MLQTPIDHNTDSFLINDRIVSFIGNSEKMRKNKNLKLIRIQNFNQISICRRYAKMNNVIIRRNVAFLNYYTFVKKA